MRYLTSLLCGVLFGIGLTISGMVNPAKVIGFLDVAGAWDPTLAFVMAGATVPMFVAWIVKKNMKNPIIEAKFDISQNTKVDRPLLIGATIFGAGWGMAGICPGPGLAALTFGESGIIIFVISMIIGMVIFNVSQRSFR